MQNGLHLNIETSLWSVLVLKTKQNKYLMVVFIMLKAHVS